jgi:hypothetical protein
MKAKLVRSLNIDLLVARSETREHKKKRVFKRSGS